MVRSSDAAVHGLRDAVCVAGGSFRFSEKSKSKAG